MLSYAITSRRLLLWGSLSLLLGLPALGGILTSANAWRVEATLRLRVGNIGMVEQSAKMCSVDLSRLSGVWAARDALALTVERNHIGVAGQFEAWLQAGRTSQLKRTPHATQAVCESFDRLIDTQNRFWQARADRWNKSDASGF